MSDDDSEDSDEKASWNSWGWGLLANGTDAGSRRIVCPHGSSLPCSQCMGAEVHVVKRDAKSGALLMDGKVVRHGMIPQEELSNLREHLEKRMTRSTTRQEREQMARNARLCPACGKKGHTKRTCPDRSKLIMQEAETIESDNRCGSCGEIGHNIRSCPYRFDEVAA